MKILFTASYILDTTVAAHQVRSYTTAIGHGVEAWRCSSLANTYSMEVDCVVRDEPCHPPDGRSKSSGTVYPGVLALRFTVETG